MFSIFRHQTICYIKREVCRACNVPGPCDVRAYLGPFLSLSFSTEAAKGTSWQLTIKLSASSGASLFLHQLSQCLVEIARDSARDLETVRLSSRQIRSPRPRAMLGIMCHQLPRSNHQNVSQYRVFFPEPAQKIEKNFPA